MYLLDRGTFKAGCQLVQHSLLLQSTTISPQELKFAAFPQIPPAERQILAADRSGTEEEEEK